MKTNRYTIQAVSDLTELSPSTIRRYEEEYSHILMPQRVLCGDKAYRVYTWKEIEMLIYVKQKTTEGYSVQQAWDSYLVFSLARCCAADILNEEIYFVHPDLDFWIEDEPAA